MIIERTADDTISNEHNPDDVNRVRKIIDQKYITIKSLKRNCSKCGGIAEILDNASKTPFCYSCGVTECFKNMDRSVKKHLTSDEIFRSSELTGYLESLQDITMKVEFMLSKLDGCKQSMGYLFRYSIDKVNLFFQMILMEFQEFYADIMTGINSCFSDSKRDINSDCKLLTTLKEDLEQTQKDIDENFEKIVIQMDIDPFAQIMENYKSKLYDTKVHIQESKCLLDRLNRISFPGFQQESRDKVKLIIQKKFSEMVDYCLYSDLDKHKKNLSEEIHFRDQLRKRISVDRLKQNISGPLSSHSPSKKNAIKLDRSLSAAYRRISTDLLNSKIETDQELQKQANKLIETVNGFMDKLGAEKHDKLDRTPKEYKENAPVKNTEVSEYKNLELEDLEISDFGDSEESNDLKEINAKRTIYLTPKSVSNSVFDEDEEERKAKLISKNLLRTISIISEKKPSKRRKKKDKNDNRFVKDLSLNILIQRKDNSISSPIIKAKSKRQSATKIFDRDKKPPKSSRNPTNKTLILGASKSKKNLKKLFTQAQGPLAFSSQKSTLGSIQKDALLQRYMKGSSSQGENSKEPFTNIYSRLRSPRKAEKIKINSIGIGASSKLNNFLGGREKSKDLHNDIDSKYEIVLQKTIVLSNKKRRLSKK